MTQIRHKHTQAVLYECEAETVKETVEQGVSAGADLAGAHLARAYLAGARLAGARLACAYLAGAYLARAYLAGADLARADLARADLAGAYLAGADLAGARLAGADLAGADLAGARLAGATIGWTSHAVVSEILRRAAGRDIAKLKVAGLIAIQHGWCWSDFLRLGDPLTDWALDALAPWVRDGDDAPDVLGGRAAELARTEHPGPTEAKP